MNIDTTQSRRQFLSRLAIAAPALALPSLTRASAPEVAPVVVPRMSLTIEWRDTTPYMDNRVEMGYVGGRPLYSIYHAPAHHAWGSGEMLWAPSFAISRPVTSGGYAASWRDSEFGRFPTRQQAVAAVEADLREFVAALGATPVAPVEAQQVEVKPLEWSVYPVIDFGPSETLPTGYSVWHGHIDRQLVGAIWHWKDRTTYEGSSMAGFSCKSVQPSLESAKAAVESAWQAHVRSLIS